MSIATNAQTIPITSNDQNVSVAGNGQDILTMFTMRTTILKENDVMKHFSLAKQYIQNWNKKGLSLL